MFLEYINSCFLTLGTIGQWSWCNGHGVYDTKSLSYGGSKQKFGLLACSSKNFTTSQV